MRALQVFQFFFFLCQPLAAQDGQLRHIFMNGVNVSQIRNQVVTNAKVTFTRNGDIHIEAPQYDVVEEDHFEPLSKATASSKTSRQSHTSTIQSGNNKNVLTPSFPLKSETVRDLPASEILRRQEINYPKDNLNNNQERSNPDPAIPANETIEP